jgi:hypothetical protein
MRELKPVGPGVNKAMNHQQSAGSKVFLCHRIGDEFETSKEKTSAASAVQAGLWSRRDEGIILQ